MPSSAIRRLTMLSLLIAVAIMLNYFERFIPIVISIPGVRLGLANVVSLVCLSLFGYRDAYIVLIMRTLLSAFFYGSLSALLFSLGGGLLALTVMALLWRYKDSFLSIIGISVAGAIFHNVGQVTVAYFILATPSIFGYLPVLLLSAIITGILIGVVTQRTIPYLQYHFDN